MQMHIVSRMFLQDVRGALFVCRVPGAHPQQKAAVFELFLQMLRGVVADEFGQDAADDTARAAGKGRAADDLGL
ncbi:hypothetical protein [uncultured Roseibium sp.]|uniref:hypothetical protein n=1 Tax=uncultured Roseibium sp. TaxID=1936171 RepID=UPI00260DCED4|nr:hypothetical protein [uncultured Roseibium sp.]